MKLWQKDTTVTAKQIEDFTVGNDRNFDLLLAPYDVQGTLAHIQMLHETGLLTQEDHHTLKQELEQILSEIRSGDFIIEPEVEDIHSQIELMLTRRVGAAGKKIHTGRSRNDQVAVDIKLFLRDELLKIRDQMVSLFDILTNLSEQHRDVLMPGYTHLQVAMPSSFGLWFGAYAESLADDLDVLATAYRVVNKNPLGSGAGYGSSFPLNRARTTSLLGFGSMHVNSVYAQMSRGRTEQSVAVALAAIGATLGRLSMDVCLYLSQNFDFISFPDALTTGSSIMPHKKNPDLFELVRGKCSRLQSLPNELMLLRHNLPSGYHRDMQLTKEILFPALTTVQDCLGIIAYALPQVRVREDILKDDKYRYVFTVEAINQLVKEGIPFREAYRQVGNEVAAGAFSYGGFAPQRHTHEGSIGNLCTEVVREEFQKVLLRFETITG